MVDATDEEHDWATAFTGIDTRGSDAADSSDPANPTMSSPAGDAQTATSDASTQDTPPPPPTDTDASTDPPVSTDGQPPVSDDADPTQDGTTPPPVGSTSTDSTASADGQPPGSDDADPTQAGSTPPPDGSTSTDPAVSTDGQPPASDDADQTQDGSTPPPDGSTSTDSTAAADGQPPGSDDADPTQDGSTPPPDGSTSTDPAVSTDGQPPGSDDADPTQDGSTPPPDGSPSTDPSAAADGQPPGGDDANPSQDGTTPPTTTDASTDNPLALTLPQVGSTNPGLGVGPAPQLSLKLTDGDLKACNDYLDANFTAVLPPGALASDPSSYKPALGGALVEVQDVVDKLMPLTLVGQSSTDTSSQMSKDAFSQLLQLVQQRLGDAASTQAKAGSPMNAGPAPQLSFQLTDADLKACNNYLDANLTVVLKRGASATDPTSYRPALGGVPVANEDVVHRLIPLTLAGQAPGGSSSQMLAGVLPQLNDLVQQRVGKASAVLIAATDDANKAAVEQGGATSAMAQSDAQSWVEDYLENQHSLAPDQTADAGSRNVLFDGKTTLIATVVNTTLADAKTADLSSGDAGRSFITSKLITTAIATILLKAQPGGNPSKKVNISLQLGVMFIPDTVHVTADGTTTHDQPGGQLSGNLDFAFHGDEDSGWDVSAVGQATWFADNAGGKIKTQSGLGGAQVAWVWSFLHGALQAGPLFDLLAGASRAQQKASKNLEWEPTGQVGVGGQVQYTLPGFGGNLSVGLQAGGSATVARGAASTADATAGMTFVWKF